MICFWYLPSTRIEVWNDFEDTSTNMTLFSSLSSFVALVLSNLTEMYDSKYWAWWLVHSVQKHTIHQDQFPMTAAYGFTDYWSQGQTILYVLVDIVSPLTGTLSLLNLYVALSRSLGWSTIRLLLEFWWETLSKFSWHMAIGWGWQAGQTISDHETKMTKRED